MPYLKPLKERYPRPGLEREKPLKHLREGEWTYRVREIGWIEGRRRLALERTVIVELEADVAFDYYADGEMLSDFVNLLYDGPGDITNDYNDGAMLWNELATLMDGDDNDDD